MNLLGKILSFAMIESPTFVFNRRCRLLLSPTAQQQHLLSPLLPFNPLHPIVHPINSCNTFPVFSPLPPSPPIAHPPFNAQEEHARPISSACTHSMVNPPRPLRQDVLLLSSSCLSHLKAPETLKKTISHTPRNVYPSLLLK